MLIRLTVDSIFTSAVFEYSTNIGDMINENAQLAECSEMNAPLIQETSYKRADIETSAIRKLNLRIALICASITFIAYVDRGNLGIAASKICAALDLSHSEYGIGASLFSVGYVAFQVPSSLLLKRFGAVRWLSCMLVCWGACTTLLAFVNNAMQFYVLRLLLGVAQGGCFPGCWYYLSTFFPKLYIAFPFALIEASVQLASPAAAPLAAGLLALDGVFGIDGWRLLFFIEGVIPIVFGLVLPWILPSILEEAKFLTENEKAFLESEVKPDQCPSSLGISGQLINLVSNIAFWSSSFYCFLHFVLLDTGTYWTTLIIGDMLQEGEENEEKSETCDPSNSKPILAVLLSVVPFTICVSFCVFIGYISPKIKNRSLTSCFIASFGTVFWVIWAFSHHAAFIVALLALGLAISCPNMITSLVLGVFTCHFDVETRTTGLAIVNTIGGIGGGLGTLLVGELVETYGYSSAAFFLATVALFSGLVLLPMHDPLHKPILQEEALYDEI